MHFYCGGLFLARIERSIEVFASPEEVFRYLRELERMPEWMPSCKSHRITSERRYGVGVTSHCVMDHSGRTIEWDSVITEWEENRRLTWHCEEPTKNDGTFLLEPTERGTKVTFIMNYELPYSVLGMIIDRLKVSKEIERDIAEALSRLKEKVER